LIKGKDIKNTTQIIKTDPALFTVTGVEGLRCRLKMGDRRFNRPLA
jgi:hypothetical protein